MLFERVISFFTFLVFFFIDNAIEAIDEFAFLEGDVMFFKYIN